MPSRLPWSRVLLPLLLTHVLTNCGSVPGPGPTTAQIAQRSKNVEIRTLAAPDGRDLAYVVHQPARLNPRRAAFLYLHGIESHSGWFDSAAALLARRGYPVFSLDRRGSGLNRENRGFVSGHVPRGTPLVDDVHQAVSTIRSTGSYDEIYLIGLSWGGKYAMAYDASYPNKVDGMILITPGMKPKVDVTAREKAAIFTDALLAPTRQHRIPIEPEMFTTTPRFLHYIKNDPLKLHTTSASFLMQSKHLDKVIDRTTSVPRPPMLVFLAGQDRIIDNNATRSLVTRDPQRSVRIIDYPDQTHSIQLDAPQRLTRDIDLWVRSLPSKP